MMFSVGMEEDVRQGDASVFPFNKKAMDKRILLADVEEGIRPVLRIALADSGYRVLTAENGEEAFKLFKEAKPPIVLTDIKMPGMCGIELLRKIKQADPAHQHGADSECRR